MWSTQEGFSSLIHFPEVPLLPCVLNKVFSNKLSCLLHCNILPTRAYIFQYVGMPSDESWMENEVESGTWIALVPHIISFPLTRLYSHTSWVVGVWTLLPAAGCPGIQAVSAPYVSEANKQTVCCLAGSACCAFRQFQAKTVFQAFASSLLQALLKAWTSRLVWVWGYLHVVKGTCTKAVTSQEIRGSHRDALLTAPS